MPGWVLRDQKHPQGPSSGWMQSKTERQPAADLIHKGIARLPEPKAKSTFRRVGLRQTEEIKSHTKKKKVENLTISRITVGLWEVHGQEQGWNPRGNSRVLGESAATLLGLLGQFLKQVVKNLSQKAVYLHASYSRDFSSLWQCLLHWYLRQQIPAPWNQPHSSLTTLASPAMKFNLWHCCTFHLNFHLERSSVWRPCSLSC